ncbi:MAG: alkaline phosphatase family protein [Candidatus Odinarchaeota archaeon]
MLDRDKLIEELTQFIKPIKGFDGIYRPNYDRNITMILPTLIRSLGLELGECETLYSDSRLKNILADILNDNIENIVFIVMDSLGFKQFNKYSRFFVENAFYFPVSSVFPTITSTAIMSLHTGKYPEQHGLLGYKILIAELGTIIDTLKFSSEKAQFRDSLTKLGLNFSNYLWEQSIHKNISKDSLMDVSLYNYSIAATGLSTILHNNIVSFGDIIDAFSLANKLLCKEDNKKKLIHIYLDMVDELSHKYGPESPQIEMSFKMFEESLKAIKLGLTEEVAEKTVLVLTSDHGQRTVDPSKILNMQDIDSEVNAKYFRGGVGKSGRTLHFYTKPGMFDEAFNLISETVSDRGFVFKYEELAKLIFHKKPSNFKVKQRMGDIICVLTGEHTASLKNHEGENKIVDATLLGQHGGLSYDELCSVCAFINLKEI